jgi:hypothetical protein
MAEVMAQANSDLILLLAEAAEVSLLPTITRGWSRIGQQRVIPPPGVHAAQHWAWGAVDPVSGRTVHILHPRRTRRGFRRWRAALSRAFELPTHPPRRLILLVDHDQAPRAQVGQRWLSKYPPVFRSSGSRPIPQS